MSREFVSGHLSLRPLALTPDGWSLEVLDQAALPHAERTVRLASCGDVVRAIATMQVRGAPLIGIAAAYGVALAMRSDASAAGLADAMLALRASRPTAVNLGWALDRMRLLLEAARPADRVALAYREAAAIAEEKWQPAAPSATTGSVCCGRTGKRRAHRGRYGS